MTYEKTLRQWAEYYGVTFTIYKNRIKGHAYEGKHHFKVGKHKSRNHALRDVTHELAHYVVSSPARRTKVNFGLGCGPLDACLYGCKLCHATVSDAQAEECHASMLGILMVARLEGAEVALEELDEHCWQSYDALEHVRKPKFIKYVVDFTDHTGVNLLNLNSVLTAQQRQRYGALAF